MDEWMDEVQERDDAWMGLAVQSVSEAVFFELPNSSFRPLTS